MFGIIIISNQSVFSKEMDNMSKGKETYNKLVDLKLIP